jgi:beta-lactamase superfamily II metal-dependent hydrolase
MPAPTLAILDVGHGSAAVLQDGAHVVVLDAGPGSSLLEFLTEQAITAIDVLLLSHADQDHIEGVISVLGSGIVTVKQVWVNSDAEKGSKLWDDLTFALDEQQRAGTLKFQVSLTDADTGKFDTRSVSVEILAPSSYLAARGPGSTDRAGRRLTANSISAVVRLVGRTTGKPLAILLGDIDEVGFQNLRAPARGLRAPVLVFPHHGGRSGSPQEEQYAANICAAVRPRTVVFSLGRGRHMNPLPEIVDGIRLSAPRARIVCTQLSEHCASRPPGTEPGHLANVFARGREADHCCGGTLIVEETGTVVPAAVDHRSFIDGAAPTALCVLARPGARGSRRSPGHRKRTPVGKAGKPRR